MLELLFKAALILLGFGFLHLLKRYTEWICNPLRGAPGPNWEGFWVGEFFTIQNEAFMQPALRWIRESAIGWHAPFLRYSCFLGRPTILILDKEVVKDILSAPYGKEPLRFAKNMNFLKNILGEGLVTAEGEDWMRHRQIIQPAFFTHVLKESLAATVPSLTQEFVNCWKQSQGREIDVVSHLSSLSLDIIGRVAFSHEFGAMESVHSWAAGELEGDELLASVKDPIVKAMEQCFQPNLFGTMAFLFELPWLARYFNLKTRRARAALNAATDQVIDNAKEKMKDSSTRSLLQLLMEASERDESAKKTLNHTELRDEATTFIFAGHETTSTWCTMAIYSLVAYPGVQEKVYKDILKHAPKSTSAPLDLATVEKMEYLHAFLEEVLRMHPPVGMISRVTTVKENFGGYAVPAGTRLWIPMYLLHRHPKYWDDPETFKPERWVNRTADDQNETRFAFLPFSACGRNCIGQRFATVEAKLMMAEIIRSLDIQLAPSQKDTKFTFTNRPVMKIKPGLRIVVKSRD
jgi:cytochrome P450